MRCSEYGYAILFLACELLYYPLLLFLCIVPLCNIVINWWTSTLNTPHGTTIIFYFNVCIKFSRFSLQFLYYFSCLDRERELVSCTCEPIKKTNTKKTNCQRRTCSQLIDKVELLSHLFSLTWRVVWVLNVDRFSMGCEIFFFKDK